MTLSGVVIICVASFLTASFVGWLEKHVFLSSERGQLEFGLPTDVSKEFDLMRKRIAELEQQVSLSVIPGSIQVGSFVTHAFAKPTYDYKMLYIESLKAIPLGSTYVRTFYGSPLLTAEEDSFDKYISQEVMKDYDQLVTLPEPVAEEQQLERQKSVA